METPVKPQQPIDAFAKMVVHGVLRNEDFSRDELNSAFNRVMHDHSRSEEAEDEWCEKIKDFRENLKDVLAKTHNTLKRYAGVDPVDPKFQGLMPSVENLDEILTFSHKLAYSSFAPSGFEMGDHLGPFKPPAPQAQQFLASKLHDFAEHYTPRKKVKAEEMDVKVENVQELPEVKHEIKREPSSTDRSSSHDASLVKEEPDTDGLQIEVEMPMAIKNEEQEMKPSTDVGFDFVLNPDLEESEDQSPGSSVEISSTDED